MATSDDQPVLPRPLRSPRSRSLPISITRKREAAAKSKSPPVDPRQKELPPTPTSENQLPIRRRRTRLQKSKTNPTERHYADQLVAREQRIHQYFQDRFFEHKAYVCRDDPFEEIFELPIDEHFTSEPHKSARDLDEICEVFNRCASSEGLNPMKRFLSSHPKDEHAFVDSLCLMQNSCTAGQHPALGSDSAESAASHMDNPHSRTLQQRGSGSTDRRRGNRQSLRQPHDSWYEPDSDHASDESEQSTVWQITPSSGDMGVAMIMRNVIATFETLTDNGEW